MVPPLGPLVRLLLVRKVLLPPLVAIEQRRARILRHLLRLLRGGEAGHDPVAGGGAEVPVRRLPARVDHLSPLAQVERLDRRLAQLLHELRAGALDDEEARRPLLAPTRVPVREAVARVAAEELAQA